MLTRARFMRILGPVVAVLLTAAPYAAAQQAVIVVRHAEKADQTPDSALSAKGQARARALADLLRGAGVTHVITSEFLRTRQTAAPLATALGWPGTLTLQEGDFDNVFVLAPHPGQRTSMVRLKYGQPSS